MRFQYLIIGSIPRQCDGVKTILIRAVHVQNVVVLQLFSKSFLQNIFNLAHQILEMLLSTKIKILIYQLTPINN